jgi:Copper binding periplasmic protein CusF
MKIAEKTVEKTGMKKATLILAGAMALTILSSAALAQQALSGTVTAVNRIRSTIVIQPAPSGTVGANTGGAAQTTGGVAQEYKLQDGLSLDDWHAGDQVAFSVTNTDPVKTITKLQKQ